MNSEDVVPPLAANMSAAFKKVWGAIGAVDPELTDLIVTRIVELAKAGVYDIEELSSVSFTLPRHYTAALSAAVIEIEPHLKLMYEKAILKYTTAGSTRAAMMSVLTSTP